MNRVNRTVFSLHRISGTIIAVFFFMWFCTGIVLVYHGFPRLDNRKAIELAGPLPQENPLPDSLPNGMNTLSIHRLHGQTVVEWATKDTSVATGAAGLPLRPVDFATALAEARLWCDGRIIETDTLHERDQWIMYSSYLRELPIYKFYFDDPEKTQVYVGKESGKVLQVTDRASRFWAWVGAIPHKLYIPSMRSDVEIWKRWLLTGGLLCLIASLTGIYAAVVLLIRYHRKHGRWGNPMHGRMMRFHLILGLVFGIPLVAWSISGIFSMQKVPRWLVGFDGPEYVSERKLWGGGMAPCGEYNTDYETIIHAYPEARDISYSRRGDIPVIEVTTPDEHIVLDARSHEPATLWINPEEATKAVTEIVGEKSHLSLTLLDKYDAHYFSLNDRAPLPVYKIAVKNSDGTLFYIDPKTGDVTYLNHNRIARKILFSGIHYLNLLPFAGREILWKICMWIVCLTGMVFCTSAIWLGFKYLIRKVKGLHRKGFGHNTARHTI